jgi:rare lipoprotein A
LNKSTGTRAYPCFTLLADAVRLRAQLTTGRRSTLIARTAKTTLRCLSLAALLAAFAPASRAAEEQTASEIARSVAAEPVERAASSVSKFERVTSAAGAAVSTAASAATTVATSAANAATTVATTAANSATNAAVGAATAATAAVFSVASVATTTAVNAATAAATLFQTGRVSFYADKFHGRLTASGAPYDAQEMTMAHRTLPIGTKVMITNTANQRSVVVTVNDRGPFTGGRVADLSRAAAEKLNMIRAGIAEATLHVLPNSGNKQDSKIKVR